MSMISTHSLYLKVVRYDLKISIHHNAIFSTEIYLVHSMLIFVNINLYNCSCDYLYSFCVMCPLLYV
jgi:hypothetical protein